MTTEWVRTLNTATSFDKGWFLLGQLGAGSTLKRIRWSWGFQGWTADYADLYSTAANVMAAGICTVIGTGSEAPPTPITDSSDVAPPTQRWVWVEARQPVNHAIDHASGVASWRDSGAQDPPDVRAQVLATGFSGLDLLDVWFSYESLLGLWDPSGVVSIWVTASVLINNP